jgi:uncharacterized protein (DUF1330 family)
MTVSDCSAAASGLSGRWRRRFPVTGGGAQQRYRTHDISVASRRLFKSAGRRFGHRVAGDHIGGTHGKGYWITFYRSISDPAALAAYAKLAGPAIASNGGRFLARGGTVKTYEQGIAQRTVVIEFDSVEKAIAAHDSPAYREALAALGNACERDMRIVEGVD